MAAALLLCTGMLCATACNYDPRPEPLYRAKVVQAPAAPRGIRVEPREIIDCGGTVGIAGEVSWNFSDRPDVAQVQIELRAPGADSGQLFAQGGAQGAAATGPWLSPRLRFLAIDMRSGRVLGETEIHAYPCG